MTKFRTKPNHTIPEARFSSVLEESDNRLWGAHVGVPAQIAKRFIEGTTRRVLCSINGAHENQCALVPHGGGSFVITVNKKLRDTLGLKFGMRVTVRLRKDQSKYGLPMPEEFAVLLRQDKEGNKLFHALTPGKQRTLLYIVGKSTNTEERIGKAMTIVEHLKSHHGTINYRILNASLRKSAHLL